MFVLLFTLIVFTSCKPDNNKYLLNDGILKLNLSKTSSNIPVGTTKISILFQSFYKKTFQTKAFNGNNIEFNIKIDNGIYKLYIACFNSNNELLGIYYNGNFEINENIANIPDINISKLEFKLDNLKGLNSSPYKDTITPYDSRDVKFYQFNAKLNISAQNLLHFLDSVSGSKVFTEYYKHETWDKYYGMNFSTSFYNFIEKESNQNYPLYYTFSSSNNNKIVINNFLVLKPIEYNDASQNYPEGKNYILVESKPLIFGDQTFYIRKELNSFEYTNKLNFNINLLDNTKKLIIVYNENIIIKEITDNKNIINLSKYLK
jgi:hypothetical protein